MRHHIDAFVQGFRVVACVDAEDLHFRQIQAQRLTTGRISRESAEVPGQFQYCLSRVLQNRFLEQAAEVEKLTLP